MGSESYHEDPGHLSEKTIDLHRALVSLKEELDAVDWYQQRIEATDDEALKRILAHNRAEEMEHASMLLEWIRRHEPGFDTELRKFLFTQGDIAGMEATD